MKAGKKQAKSVVAITRGSRWEAKKVIKKGLDLIGGIRTVSKKGDVVLLKPNLGYPEAEGMPPWTCTTDSVVLAALTELFLEAGAKKVITADGPAHGISAEYMFKSTGIKAAVEEVGGEVVYLDQADYVLRDVPGGVILKRQWIPKICMDVELIVNVPKIKPTRVGKFTLGYKNLFGCVPLDERLPWHRMPEHFFFLVDLYKLLPCKLTVMDGLVIQEGYGPRFGTPVDWNGIVMGRDPVATEAVTMLAMGHEPYEQSVLPIAAKAGQGTMDIKNIEIRGETIDSMKRYCKVAPADVFVHPSPNVIEYCGGACAYCARWFQNTPFPWEIKPNRKYAVVVGTSPRLPDHFEEDEVVVFGKCALMSRAKIQSACKRRGIRPQFFGGCPPNRKHGYLRLHKIDKLPRTEKINRVKE
jgi:uncharacterized protein (DUF362 family)